MSYDEAIKDLKDELLLTDPEDAVRSVASAYKLDVTELKARATEEIGDLSTYAERVAVAKADADRLKAIAEQVEAEAGVISKLGSLLSKLES